MTDLLPAARPDRLPDTLDDLAAVARAEHDAFERDARSAIAHAIRAGEALTAAKAKVAHGEWLPWLEANFPATRRTASNYMALAANGKRVAHLDTVRAGLAELTSPREAEPLEPETAAQLMARIDAESDAFGENVAALSADEHIGRAAALIYQGGLIDEAMIRLGQEIAHDAMHEINDNPADAAHALKIASLFMRLGSSDPWGAERDAIRDELRCALDDAAVAR
jgi:hypothetical protein